MSLLCLERRRSAGMQKSWAGVQEARKRACCSQGSEVKRLLRERAWRDGGGARATGCVIPL